MSPLRRERNRVSLLPLIYEFKFYPAGAPLEGKASRVPGSPARQKSQTPASRSASAPVAFPAAPTHRQRSNGEWAPKKPAGRAPWRVDAARPAPAARKDGLFRSPARRPGERPGKYGALDKRRQHCDELAGARAAHLGSAAGGEFRVCTCVRRVQPKGACGREGRQAQIMDAPKE